MFPEIVLSLLMLVPGGGHRFYHISVEDGLSQNTVFSVTQDAGGSMWFATYEGVDCFDGYNFYPYRLVNGYEDGKTEHVDTKVLADGDDVVWANTGTLSYFDGSAFVPVPGLSEMTVRTFAANPLGGVILLTDKGFMAARKGAVEKAPEWLAEMKGAYAVSSCDSLIAVATVDGRLSVRHASSGMETFSAPFAFCSEISDLLPDSDGVLWAGTYGNGLFRLCGDECRHFQHLRDDGGSLCSNYVKSLCRDGLGHIWIGTGNGLSILDEESLAFENVFYDSAERYGLSHNSVKSVFRDSAGDMWLGTYYGGVNYCHPGVSPFERVALSDGGSGSIIGGIAEDSDGTLWIGTSRNGVYHYNPETGTSRHLSLYSDDAEMDDIKAIRFSADGESIYFGTGLGGLNVYSRRNGEVRHFKGDGHPVAVYSILPEGGVDICGWDLFRDCFSLMFRTVRRGWCFPFRTGGFSSIPFTGTVRGSCG